jgi:uncharacterized membrane protein
MPVTERWLFALKLFSALGCGLIAGVFFAFSVFVMSALARLQPAQGIVAMQSINIRVLNPLFLGVFMGTHYCDGSNPVPPFCWPAACFIS